MRTIIAAMVLWTAFAASVAFAQYGWPANNPPLKAPTAADYAQLPLSVLTQFSAPTGWTVDEMWVKAIWPRNAAGAWYRPDGYTPVSATRSKLFAWTYTCTAHGESFHCSDYRGVHVVACPAHVARSWARYWRSKYNGAGDKNAGLFPWLSFGEKWSANFLRNIPLRPGSARVTADGKGMSCSYGNDVRQGPGTAYDLWVWRR